MQSCPPGVDTPVTFALPPGSAPTGLRWRVLDEGELVLQDWTPVGAVSPDTPFGGFADPMDAPDLERWRASAWVNGDPFLNAWSPAQLAFAGGKLDIALQADPAMVSGRPAVSGEYATVSTYGHGTYRFTARASNTPGVINGLFTYTGTAEGTQHDEIDIEIKGDDPTKMQVNYWTNDVEHPTVINLGFDASLAHHEYAFEWTPTSIRWFVDGVQVHEETGVRGPLPVTPGKVFLNLWGTVGTMPWSTDYVPSATPSVLSIDAVSFEPYAEAAAPAEPTEPSVPAEPLPAPDPLAPVLVVQTIPAALLTLAAPATRGIRVVELEVTGVVGLSLLAQELLLQGASALAAGANTFLTYNQASLTSMDFVPTQLPGWTEATRAERESALMEAFRRIMQLPIGPKFSDEQNRLTEVSVFGARMLRDMAPADRLRLEPRMLADLRLAQLVEADEVLAPDQVIEARFNGLQSVSAGESTQLFRYTMPLKLSVSPRAMAYLQRWVRYGARIGRS